MNNPEEIKLRFLKDRLDFYKEENAKMECMFKKLKISPDELQKRCNMLESVLSLPIETRDLKISTLRLSQAEKIRKHANYVSKLKICIKFYLNLNEKLLTELKTAQRDLNQSKIELTSTLKLSTQELHQLEEKVKKYENELTKFEKKYPWLKDKDFDLPNIMKEVDTLKSLREEKSNLLKELSVYQDLKPDIKEASDQLNQLKIEHKKFCSSVFHIN